MGKPPRTFWQIWNMSFGFLGIQFGWGHIPFDSLFTSAPGRS